ncbi:hypothetical protein [Paraburkholderia domus]|uniref:hypothetical protein n=1 Tax=Paraburkholderia domus TaxID=2793075 RepID=UPI001913076C|nr:hypothetical protein [Paraburkholderia domus]MBK5054542.1 hypothetical protein [Burkholderia sp. R-70006]MBK5124942.1 hypothetical protein [Burkholderia sp. R-69980]MBK5186312.1 hypothetical protein [Burkholderia sp. R-69749]CAE6820705.1 hypothetical protein R75483_06228 [Paraburkholderia domus]CAE6862411.1 hypothetical protein R70006_08155 [Paraburkholderia domus]
MDHEQLASALRRLASTSPKRSKVSHLKALLPDIEAALAARVPAADILNTLREQGLDISLRTFHGTLYRLRKIASTPGSGSKSGAAAARPGAPPPVTASLATAPLEAHKPAPPTTNAPAQTRIKTFEQLQSENPHLSSMQLNHLYAEQYGEPRVSNADIDALKKKYPRHAKP